MPSSVSYKLKSKKAIAYIYLDKTNDRWVKEIAIDLDQTFSYVVDRCLECFRKGEPLKLEKKIPFTVKQTQEAKRKRVQKLEAMAR